MAQLEFVALLLGLCETGGVLLLRDCVVGAIPPVLGNGPSYKETGGLPYDGTLGSNQRAKAMGHHRRMATADAGHGGNRPEPAAYSEIMSKLLRTRREDSNFSRFTSLLDSSLYDEEGIRYSLPDHVYSEESSKW